MNIKIKKKDKKDHKFGKQNYIINSGIILTRRVACG